jgi:predicted CoA-binding protein
MSSMAAIRDFLAQRSITIVGVSRDAGELSRMLFRTLRKRGCNVFAVNPAMDTVDDVPCYPSLRHLPAPVDGVLVMASPAVTDQVVRECADLCIPRVWMYRAGGQGAVSKPAIEFCKEHGIAVVPGECPYMFLSGEPWYHRFHGVIRKVAGSYPA